MYTPVNFPLAKLLKEKGFDTPTLSFYFKNGAVGYGQLYNWNESHNSTDISRPTIAEVVMWLYEKYGIWISVEPPFPKRVVLWEYYIQKSEDRFLLGQNSGYSSPTEAYEAAIEYTLNNLLI